VGAGNRVQRRERGVENLDRSKQFVTSGAEAPNIFSVVGGTIEIVPPTNALGKLQGGQGHNGTKKFD
jgi:hypothetical protein